MSKLSTAVTCTTNTAPGVSFIREIQINIVINDHTSVIFAESEVFWNTGGWSLTSVTSMLI